MGFRFHNLNPIYRAYITRMSSPRTHKYSHPYPVTQNLISHLRDPPLTLSQNLIYNIPVRWHLGHSHHDDDDGHHHHISGQEGEKIFKLGLASDIALSTGKALTGYLSGSTAIIADAAHSVSDVVLSGIALWSFKAAKAPRDEEHPYGHGKFETLGALGISCMLLATAGGIAWHALELLLVLISADPQMVNHSLTHEHGHSHNHGDHHHGIDMNHPVLAVNMTILSIGVKEGLYWITKRVGEKQGSGLMIANAWHHRADAVSSVVALIGVGGAIMGIKFLDPLAGLVVSGMILKAGLQTGYQSVMELVDSAIPLKYLDPVKQTILQVEGVKGCHHLRGRRAGSSLYVDVNIEVDPFSSVSAAHEIGEHVRHQIHKSHPEVAEVFIHIDPAISQVCSSVMNRKSTVNYCKAAPSIKEFKEGEATAYPKSSSVEDKDIEDTVSNIISSKFPEIMVVEHVTQHLLQRKMILQIEVSMPPDMLVRDAMEVAKKAEQEILKAAPTSNIIHVSIQLRLGHPMPPANHDSIN